jgi:hypothetical protein
MDPYIVYTFREQLVLSVKPVLSLIKILKILMIKMWIGLKLIPSHDLNKIWLKLISRDSTSDEGRHGGVT